MTEQTAYRYEDLTDKYTPLQKLFASAYVGEAKFNGTEACRIAGYKGSDNVLGVQAYTNLRLPKIKILIDQYLEYRMMSDEEAALVHTRLARGSVEHFLAFRPGGVELDLSSEEAKKHLYLIKSITEEKVVTRKTSRDPETGEPHQVVQATIKHKLNLYDAGQNAERIRRALGSYGAKGTEDDPHTITFRLIDGDTPS